MYILMYLYVDFPVFCTWRKAHKSACNTVHTQQSKILNFNLQVITVKMRKNIHLRQIFNLTHKQ